MNIANLNTSKTDARMNQSAACLTAALLLALGAPFGAGAQTACLTAADSPETGATVCAAQLAPQTSGTNQIDRGVTPDGIVEGSRLQAQAFVPTPSAPAGASLELHTAGAATESGYRVEVRIVSVSLPAVADATVAAVVGTTAGQYESFQQLASVSEAEADFAFELRFGERIDVSELEADLVKALSAFAGGEVLIP